MSETFRNWIGGEWVPAKSGRTFPNVSPADSNDVLGTFPDSGAEDVDAAVRAARSAYASWRLVPAPRRAEILFRAARVLEERKESHAREMTREMGKVLKETRGDVQEAIDTAYYAGGEGRRLFGDTVPAELPNKFAMSVRCPVGVAGLITPWNFPMAIPSWKIFPAIVCGNTVVLKPAELTPLSSLRFCEALEAAGIPKGVVNLVHGGGTTVGRPIVEHPSIPLVSFTGSTEVGREIAERGGRALKRVSLEMGGKNAQIVMEDADLDLAVEGVLWGAFGTTGQRCTATSRLIVHERVAKEVTERVVALAAKLRVGNGLEDGVDVGPLVSKDQLETVERYVEIGKKEGAKVLCGGRRLAEGALARGHFYAPTVFADVKPSMRIAREEIFGPVLAVIAVKGFDEAVAVLNDTDYGLSSSIYTKDVARAFQAIRDVEAGITYVNGPTIGAEVQLPFGGVKSTGNGHREAGSAVLDFYTEWKSVYVDYSGRLQKAQIDR
jgi:aldehyde dehydrogenase (NAD+)